MCKRGLAVLQALINRIGKLTKSKKGTEFDFMLIYSPL